MACGDDPGSTRIRAFTDAARYPGWNRTWAKRPPATARFPGYETDRASLTSPFQLEDVLWKHPKLRVYIMHYGSPLVDETIAMLNTHPNLYVDISGNVGGAPRAHFGAIATAY